MLAARLAAMRGFLRSTKMPLALHRSQQADRASEASVPQQLALGCLGRDPGSNARLARRLDKLCACDVPGLSDKRRGPRNVMRRRRVTRKDTHRE